jgi:large conductance mechanosensitive channel
MTRPALLTDPSKKAFSLLEEFRAFALKGSVIDLAVGVIIGAAFGAIVKSLVDNIFMPLIGAIMPGGKGYEGWVWVLNGSEVRVGAFLASVVNFLIVAGALFILIQKFLGWIMRTRKEEIAQVPPMTKDQELLTEIRDLMKAAASGRAPA